MEFFSQNTQKMQNMTIFIRFFAKLIIYSRDTGLIINNNFYCCRSSKDTTNEVCLIINNNFYCCRCISAEDSQSGLIINNNFYCCRLDKHGTDDEV